MKGFLSRWGPALVLMAVIFAASATPGEDLPNAGAWDTLFKKGGHLLGYALLGAAYLRGLAWSRRPSLRDVAEGTGLSKRGVQEALSILARRRLVGIARQSITDVPVYTVKRPWRRHVR